jgi:hypothetical protein
MSRFALLKLGFTGFVFAGFSRSDCDWLTLGSLNHICNANGSFDFFSGTTVDGLLRSHFGISAGIRTGLIS